MGELADRMMRVVAETKLAVEPKSMKKLGPFTGISANHSIGLVKQEKQID